MSPERDQLVLMGLAHLAVERPGWYDYCRTTAADGYQAEGLFDVLYRLHKARLYTGGGPGIQESDGIMDLRAVVQRTNPLLWEMVREIAWPGGQS